MSESTTELPEPENFDAGIGGSCFTAVPQCWFPYNLLTYILARTHLLMTLVLLSRLQHFNEMLVVKVDFLEICVMA